MAGTLNKFKKMYLDEYRSAPIPTVLITSLIVFLLIFVIAGIVTGGESIYNLLWYNHEVFFSDYFDSVEYSHSNPYSDPSHSVIYPPLATLFYDIIGRLIIPFVGDLGGDTLSVALRGSQMGMMSYFVMVLITFYVLHLIVDRIVGNTNGIRSGLLFLLILLSYPSIYAVERGNNILITVIMCLIFLMGYRSENKFIRYFSYIALGIAAGFKIYPALFGLLIVRERRYAEALKCIIIGVVIFLVPFVFTDGTPIMMIENIVSHISSGGLAYGFINVSQFVSTLFQYLLPQSTVSMLSIIGTLTLTLLSLFAIFFDRRMKFWKVVALISCNLVLGFGVGTQYIFAYMMIPLLFFLTSETEITRENLFFLICFIMVMALFTGFDYYMDGASQVTLSSIKSVFVMVMTTALLLESWRNILKERIGSHHEPAVY